MQFWGTSRSERGRKWEKKQSPRGSLRFPEAFTCLEPSDMSATAKKKKKHAVVLTGSAGSFSSTALYLGKAGQVVLDAKTARGRESVTDGVFKTSSANFCQIFPAPKSYSVQSPSSLFPRPIRTIHFYLRFWVFSFIKHLRIGSISEP